MPLSGRGAAHATLGRKQRVPPPRSAPAVGYVSGSQKPGHYGKAKSATSDDGKTWASSLLGFGDHQKSGRLLGTKVACFFIAADMGYAARRRRKRLDCFVACRTRAMNDSRR